MNNYEMLKVFSVVITIVFILYVRSKRKELAMYNDTMIFESFLHHFILMCLQEIKCKNKLQKMECRDVENYVIERVRSDEYKKQYEYWNYMSKKRKIFSMDQSVEECLKDSLRYFTTMPEYHVSESFVPYNLDTDKEWLKYKNSK